MDSKIFSLGLSDDAVSLYMILAALDMEGAPMESALYRKRWNGSPEALPRAVAELQGHKVIDELGGTIVVRPSVDWI